jgi:hypothetical protein
MADAVMADVLIVDVAMVAVGEKSIATIIDPRAISRLVVMITMAGPTEPTGLSGLSGLTGRIATAAEIEDTMTQAEAAAAHDLPVDMAETKRNPIAGEVPAPTVDRGTRRNLIFHVDTVQMFQMCKSSCSRMSAQTLALGSKAPSRPKV